MLQGDELMSVVELPKAFASMNKTLNKRRKLCEKFSRWWVYRKTLSMNLQEARSEEWMFEQLKSRVGARWRIRCKWQRSVSPLKCTGQKSVRKRDNFRDFMNRVKAWLYKLWVKSAMNAAAGTLGEIQPILSCVQQFFHDVCVTDVTQSEQL